MATHEENVKDPVWLNAQLDQRKEELRKVQEKHDAQIATVNDQQRIITGLNDALNSWKEKCAALSSQLQEATAGLEEVKQANGALSVNLTSLKGDVEKYLSLAKARRTGLADVMKVIAPLLAQE